MSIVFFSAKEHCIINKINNKIWRFVKAGRRRALTGETTFRKKSLERISSPEQLTDYIKVSNPGVWLVLAAVVLLLASALVWAVFGTLPTTLSVSAYVSNGAAVLYVDEATAGELEPGLQARIGDAEGTVASVASIPLSQAELKQKYTDDYVFSSMTAGEWNYPVEITVPGAADGLQQATLTLDRVHPIFFVTN